MKHFAMSLSRLATSREAECKPGTVNVKGESAQRGVEEQREDVEQHAQHVVEQDATARNKPESAALKET